MLHPKFITLLPCLFLPLLTPAEGLLAVDNPAKNGQTNSAYAALASFEANDQVAMQHYDGEWASDYTPRTGSNLGLLAVRAEAGLQWQGYRLGALYRADARVLANRDTSDLVHQFNTNSGYTPAHSYPLDYQVSGFEADGLRLSKRFTMNMTNAWQLDLGWGISYLHGKRIKLETMTGQVLTLNTKDFNANVNRSTSDSLMNTTDLASFNAPYGRQTSVSGSGYALDTGLVLKHPPSGASLELAVADLLGRIDWIDLPTNVATYRSGTAAKYYDANGYVNYYPAASRMSSYQNLGQNLDPKLWLAANYPLGNFELQASSSYTQGDWFPQLGVSYHLNALWQVRAEYDVRFNTLGLSLLHPWFYMGLRMDNSNIAVAKAYGITAGVNIPY